MQKRYKDLLRTLVIELRHMLVGTIAPDGTVTHGDLDRELERLGIALDGTITPLDALANPTASERQAHRIATAQLDYVAREQRANVRMEIVERAAYTWINRLFALRAMEARGLIDETLRNNPDYDGLPEALFILRQNDPGRASGADGGRWAVLEDACKVQSASLPGLFSLDDPATALRPSTPALIRCMTLVGGTMPGFTLAESDAAFADPDAIGWAYQFYQEEAKARIYAKLSSGGKVSTRSEIAAATELFTEPYMVKWLLQNSLGRSYHEIYPDSALPATWEYYVKPDQLDTSTTLDLVSLTVLDPCMGSGHFLREAFDMFVAMYREQYPSLSAAEIADPILSHHLYGIDLDPRAAQLSALTLYLRACELVRDERRKERKPGTGTYIPPAMNLATTPTSLNEGALQRHLLRHPQDRPLKPLLEGIFAGLEQADILGSLIRPKEYLDNAIAELQRPHTMRLDFDPEAAEMRRTITEVANRDPLGLRQLLLDRVVESFKAEAGNTDDVSAALFGREAEQGVRLLQLLDRRYGIVMTNPPYMDSKNFDISLKKYIEKYYVFGKRDLYAAFILRCLELCRPNGRIAMVTQQSWMFLQSYTLLRAVPEAKLVEVPKKDSFTGLQREVRIEALAHLGEFAFEEASAAGAFAAMFTINKRLPEFEHRLIAIRLVGLKSAKDKAFLLRTPALLSANTYQPLQRMLTLIPKSPMPYYLSESFLKILNSTRHLSDFATTIEGLNTTDNLRFLRYSWEVLVLSDWQQYSKGGGYKKWFGNEELTVRWATNGNRLMTYIEEKYRTHWSKRVSGISFYNKEGWVYSLLTRGSLGCRQKNFTTIFDVHSVGLFPLEGNETIIALINSHVASYILRSTISNLMFHAGYVADLPIMSLPDESCLETIKVSFILKEFVESSSITGRELRPLQLDDSFLLASFLHSCEAFLEKQAFDAYQLSSEDMQLVLSETGTPAGWYSLIAGYDALPTLPSDLTLPPLPQEVLDHLATHEWVSLDDKELARIKANLRTLYEAGPGAKNVEQEENDETTEDNEGEEEIASGAHIPIPTESFLEELSIKMQLHPISIYWLLEELRAEGVRCKPEELRLLEDRLSVLILRLLGHRWPKQLEAGEPVPTWASSDGITPLVAGTGAATLAEQVRARLRAEDGELGIQKTEALLTELTGLSLEEWLRRRFFSRHVSQFKYRPIAWRLASTPLNNGKKKRGWSQRSPAFECLLYCHACAGDALARIRTQYVGPLLRAERQRVEEAYLFTDETMSALAHEHIQELEAFVEKLQLVEEQGFACPELDRLMAVEPLDRWSGDGYLAPTNRDELLRNEQAWHVDINDGVRVNIAPLQLAGVLASDVLKLNDAKKALADRARWRADERRWVRDGKLPRCGWMDEQVPESQRWTERAPERIAEQIKLEQKRQALQNRRAEEVEL